MVLVLVFLPVLADVCPRRRHLSFTAWPALPLAITLGKFAAFIG
jgi:predicted Kef-type K+ transport protein